MRNNVERAKAIQLKLEGLTYAKIGKILGCSRQGAQYLTRPSWKVREDVRVRAKDKCEKCGLGMNSSGHYHHTSRHGKTVESFNSIDNLEYLCKKCHKKNHPNRSRKVYPKMVFPIMLPLITFMNSDSSIRTIYFTL